MTARSADRGRRAATRPAGPAVADKAAVAGFPPPAGYPATVADHTVERLEKR
jgi:hypothetical protein